MKNQRTDAKPTTAQLEDGEVHEDRDWYESSTRTFNPNNKKRGQNFEPTPNSTPQKQISSFSRRIECSLSRSFT